jgi:Dyp-type peroxidase family
MPAFTDDQLRNIQGMGLVGFKKDHSHLLFVRFGDQASGRALAQSITGLIANAWEVGHFNAVFSEIRNRTGGDELIKATWVGLAVSSSGYQKLGVNLDTELPTEAFTAFKAGMAARSLNIGDTRPGDQPAAWLPQFRPGARVDALILVAGDEPDELNEMLERIGDSISSSGCEIAHQEPGNMLSEGKEHFGFRDGGSQPVIDGYDDPPLPGEPPAAAAGEFVIGFPDQSGNTMQVGDLWTQGSFLVYRRLRQQVFDFRQLIAAGVAGANPPVTGDTMGAKLVGRWQSGAPLELNVGGDPGPGHESNAFGYAGDADGFTVPRFAHIRKANPRDETQPSPPEDPGRHRMIRRGTPFGPLLAPNAAADDGVDRGLHFISIVADIDRQFEFVQRRWVNDPNFPTGTFAGPAQPYGPPPQNVPADGVDPVVGEHDPGDRDTLHQPNGIVQFPIATELVTVTAGEYFFAPSIQALSLLAHGATASTPAQPPTPQPAAAQPPSPQPSADQPPTPQPAAAQPPSPQPPADQPPTP